MTFEIENVYPEVVLPDYETVIKNVIEAALDYEKCPYEAQVYVLLTDNEEIHEINKEHRQIDRPTDVLSFPMLSYKKAGDFAFLDEESDDDFNPDTGEAMLGDIIISVEKVQEQAKAYGHSEKREFAFLIVHSMLHLFGYDHMTPEDAAIMEPKQREILEAMNISREE
mgnify:CR=1 FL=1